MVWDFQIIDGFKSFIAENKVLLYYFHLYYQYLLSGITIISIRYTITPENAVNTVSNA